ncbi:MAG TPA: GTPase [Desulfomonilaceae bacterium]|nr:GTPase [Desulfomonilaceae bacterium]
MLDYFSPLRHMETALNRSAIAILLEGMLRFLEQDATVLLVEEKRIPFIGKVQALLEKALLPGEVLYVGIMGGTGVGKSTLINALARDEISPASDKRPFTDRAVVYRHRERLRGLEEISNLLRESDAIHDSEMIRDFILLDLPDFDSKDEHNRRNTIKILSALDGVVWVTSPEKYGDAIFYEFIQQTAFDQKNFSFVLNKSDELIDNESADPYWNLKKILGDLTLRLKQEANVQEPRIFTVSAAREYERRNGIPLLDAEFTRFRNFLISERDAKEIALAKTANLQEETRRVLDEIRRSVRPDEKIRLLKEIRDIRLEASPETAHSVKYMPNVKHGLFEYISPILLNADASIAPVRFAMRLLKFRRSRDQKDLYRDMERAFESVADTVARDRRVGLEKMAASVSSELLLAFPEGATVIGVQSAEELISSAKETAYQLFSQSLQRITQSLKGAFSVWTRLWQKTVLALPAALLIMKLLSPDSIEAWLDYPSLAGGLKIFLGFLTSLFGSEGLIGLAVLIIFEVLVIWRLAASRLRKIERMAQGLSDSAINYLEAALDSVFLRIQEDKTISMKRVEDGIEKLKALDAALP